MRRAVILLVSTLVLCTMACDQEGFLGGPCFRNGTCDDGLACTNDRCEAVDGEPEPALTPTPVEPDDGPSPDEPAPDVAPAPEPVPAPTPEPGAEPGPTPVCGDSVCGAGEPVSCPNDCAAQTYVCGNGNCEEYEIETCPADCTSNGPCGDGVCAADETPSDCPTDCTCGDGFCSNNESAATCPLDCPNAAQVESCEDTCASMIGCLPTLGNETYPGLYFACLDRCHSGSTSALAGLSACGPGSFETCSSCLLENLTTCGNDACEVFEDDTGGYSCPADCGTTQNTESECFEACGDYTREQCWFFDSEADDCYARCWGSAPARRQEFIACANPTDPLECLYQDCTAILGMKCGDLTCDDAEDAVSCPIDCAEVCGDYYCSLSETESSCPQDCSTTCGDGFCALESCSSCPQDCGQCAGFCGDGQCSPTESCSTCQSDCGTCGSICGDNVCTAGESCSSCSQDCGTCNAPGDPGACFEDFRIIISPFFNSGGAIGGPCDTYTDCIDGTVMILDDGDQCICTPLCANLVTNAADFEPCVPGDPNFICMPALAENGDWARICAHREFNFCYEVR